MQEKKRMQEKCRKGRERKRNEEPHGVESHPAGGAIDHHVVVKNKKNKKKTGGLCGWWCLATWRRRPRGLLFFSSLSFFLSFSFLPSHPGSACF